MHYLLRLLNSTDFQLFKSFVMCHVSISCSKLSVHLLSCQYTRTYMSNKFGLFVIFASMYHYRINKLYYCCSWCFLYYCRYRSQTETEEQTPSMNSYFSTNAISFIHLYLFRATVVASPRTLQFQHLLRKRKLN